MDGSREEAENAFPDYYLDFMEVDWDTNCDQCPSGVVNGEHAAADQPAASSSSEVTSTVENNVDAIGEENGVVDGVEVSVEQMQKPGDANISDDESMVDGGVHPLLFPDVVKDILSHLPAKEVEACRLVCRVWNTEGCKVLRTKRVVVLTDLDAVRVYNNAMRDTTDFPHAQFELCIQDFTGLIDEHMREFWTLFGPHIKCLEFRQTHVFWRDFLGVLEEKVPQLERLMLRHLPRNIRSGRNVIAERQYQVPAVKELRLASLPSNMTSAVDRLTDLLKVLPALEVIEFLPIKTAAAKTKVSNVLLEILRKPEVNLPNLRRLDVNLELTNEGVEGLATKQFQFERLYLTCSNGIRASAFKDFLTSLRATLSELQISFPDSFANYQSFVSNNHLKPEESVQVLSNLKSLYMTNFKGSINFVQNLPQLEQLEFTTSSLEKSIPFGFKKASGRSSSFGLTRMDDHSLKLLKIITSSSCTIAETLTLESISRCFPYLTSLQLQGVDDDGLGVIYRNLPFLSDVEFTKATCTDQGLTGIPLEICNDMVETSTFIVVQAERYRRDLFIGSLQFLRRLSIVATKISDASIALGLVDCKNLKELKIGSPLITDTGVIFVTDKFHKQLHLLDVSECPEITEQSKFYAGEKLIGKLRVCDSPQESQIQTKPIIKEVVFNPDRSLVKPKKTTAAPYVGSGTTAFAKFAAQDTEFFEEHNSEDDMRERGFPNAGVFPVDQQQRLRIIRIREALRRNEDFMRNLQRMGRDQFRRIYRRELEEAEQERRAERNIRDLRGPPRVRVRLPHNMNNPAFHLMQFHNNNEAFVGDLPVPANRPNVRQNEAVDEEPAGAGGAGVDMGPERLPEVHLAEIFRLGLRIEDVDFWLGNRGQFERDENPLNPNPNPNIDPQVLRHIRADVLFAGMNLDDEPPLDDIVAGAGEDIDLEAIRRVVMNAFGEDLPFEG